MVTYDSVQYIINMMIRMMMTILENTSKTSCGREFLGKDFFKFEENIICIICYHG